MKKRIIIVGGGYVGAELAQDLQRHADVTLIEQRTHFAHTAALVRALIDPSLLDLSLIPYDELLDEGTLVHAKVVAVSGTGVTLEDGRELSADYIVVATGSAYGMPFKPSGGDIEGFRAANHQNHEALKAAQSIAIVGAGPVGTELAGEIAHWMPDKKVTLITDETRLFPMMPKSLGTALLKKLKSVGVSVILGAKVENLESLTNPYVGTLKLSNDQQVKADLIFPAIGAKASSELLESLPGATKSTSNRIKADKWMRPSSLENVFTAGDVADFGDPMTIYATTRQIPWLAKTLKALMKDKSIHDIRPFKTLKHGGLLVPLGPKIGASYLLFFTAGDWITSMMKGKALFIPKKRTLLNKTTPRGFWKKIN